MKIKIILLALAFMPISVFAATENIPADELLVGACNKNNLCGIVNIKGEVKIPFQYSWIKASPGDFNKKKYFIAAKPKSIFYNGDLSNSVYGIIDKDGNTIVKFQYDYISDISNEIFEVKKNNLYGFIDINGNEIIPIKYKRVKSPSENLVAVSKDGKTWGYSDMNGKIVIPFEYTKAGNFTNGYAVVEKDNNSGLIDKTGKIIIDTEYNNILIAPNGLFEVIKDHKVGFINKQGKTVIPIKYKSVNANRMYEEGLIAALGENSKWGFLDENGKAVIPFIYSDAHNFNNGMAYVVKDGKSLYIDKTGKEILPGNINSPKRAELLAKLKNYDSYLYQKGFYYVKKDGYKGVLDESGNVVIPAKYYNIYNYSNGVFQVKNEDDRYLFFNKEGKLITKTAYDYASLAGDSYIQVSQMRKKPTSNPYTIYDLDEGLINNKGEVIVPLIYDRFEFYKNGYFIVTKDNKIKLLNVSGKTLIDFNKYDAFCTEHGVFSKYY